MKNVSVTLQSNPHEGHGIFWKINEVMFFFSFFELINEVKYPRGNMDLREIYMSIDRINKKTSMNPW